MLYEVITLQTLVGAGVNLLACNGFPRGRQAQIDVVPDDSRKFNRAVKKAGLAFKPKRTGFLMQGDDRPERMNAVNWDLCKELSALFHHLRGDDDVRVIVLTGAGGNFSSGGDAVLDQATPELPAVGVGHVV